MSKPGIVITGVGAVCSGGNTVDEIFSHLLSTKTKGASLNRQSSPSDCLNKGLIVKDLTPASLGIRPRDARIMRRHSLILMKAALDAWEDAGLKGAEGPGERVGFFAGMGMVDYEVDDLLPAVIKSIDPEGGIDYSRFYGGAFREIHPLWPLSMLNNIAFCQVAIRLGIKGESTVFSPHGDSTIHAFSEGMRVLLNGKADLVLAGGVSENLNENSLARAVITGITGDEETGICPAEGGALFVFEREEDARRRNANIRGVITGMGYGLASEDYAESKNAFSSAISKAISASGLVPEEIDMIFLNRSGRPIWNKAERDAIGQIFSEHSPILYSSKDTFGEMLAGSPAVDLALSLKTLEKGRLPEQNFKGYGDRDIRVVLINTMSYEGQVASIVVSTSHTHTSEV
ncbi:MAG: hypothetical protein D6726_01300 [Nitrospirae bacterium]|nr:MAG: hypothetical protein D6726_01300 [Nitrospirota bacterium]